MIILILVSLDMLKSLYFFLLFKTFIFDMYTKSYQIKLLVIK